MTNCVNIVNQAPQKQRKNMFLLIFFLFLNNDWLSNSQLMKSNNWNIFYWPYPAVRLGVFERFANFICQKIRNLTTTNMWSEGHKLSYNHRLHIQVAWAKNVQSLKIKIDCNFNYKSLSVVHVIYRMTIDQAPFALLFRKISLHGSMQWWNPTLRSKKITNVPHGVGRTWYFYWVPLEFIVSLLYSFVVYLQWITL